MDVNLRVVARQWTNNDPRAISVRRIGDNPMVFAIQQTDRNPRAKSARSYRLNPVGDKGHVKDLPAVERVFTIFGGTI